MLTAFLTPGYKVVTAINGAMALDLARLVRPDLILLDLNLEGERDGLEVCRTVRSDPDPALAQTPVVVLTGETSQADIAAALAAGADSYVGKPYSPIARLALIETVLAR